MLTLSKSITLAWCQLSRAGSVHSQRGFGAVAGVIMVASGMLAMSLAVLGTVLLYVDVVFRRELRVQHRLDQESCLASLPILRAKDAFATGRVVLSEFDCVITL